MIRTSALVLAVVCGSAVAADGSAWLGCRIGPVPESLDAHLGLQGRGTMVINVAKDSPADKAGLERYDVIVKLAGESIESPDQLIERVGKHKPGDRVALAFIQKGKEKKAEATLTARPEERVVEYKYERLPDGLLDDRIGIRGRLFRRGPDGWRVEDMGEFEDVPRWFHRSLPKTHRRQGRYWLGRDDGPVTKFQARVTRDGKTIEVKSTDDGQISVHRSPGKSGNDETVVYPAPEDLKKSDPEAYKIYLDATGRHGKGKSILQHRPPVRRKDKGDPRVLERHRRRLRDMFGDLPSADELFDREWLNEVYETKRKEWREALEKEYKATRKRLAEMEKLIEDRLEQLRSSAPGSGKDDAADATTRFEVAPDGKVTVHLREGDTELTQHFKDVAELKAKRPNLFEKYESLNKTP